MRKLLFFVTLLTLTVVPWVSAQETTGENSTRVFSTYRLDFSFNELEDGKKVNTRSYTMIMQDTPMYSKPDAWSELKTMKAVTRVPVVTAASKADTPATTTFIDVGLSILARLRMHGATMDIDGNVELGSLAQPDQAASGHPVFRVVESNFSAEVTPGKPMLIASMDDISSTRRYEVEVTATKVK